MAVFFQNTEDQDYLYVYSVDFIISVIGIFLLVVLFV
jgi:hypothetical protein